MADGTAMRDDSALDIAWKGGRAAFVEMVRAGAVQNDDDAQTALSAFAYTASLTIAENHPDVKSGKIDMFDQQEKTLRHWAELLGEFADKVHMTARKPANDGLN